MLIAIIGENCVGKSTLADQLNQKISALTYTGKDYLKLEKNPLVARDKFKAILSEAVNGNNIIYIITEKEHIDFLPKGTIKIVLTAELSTIKERFRNRLRGNLPLPLEKSLEAKHGIFDDLECDLKLNANYDIDAVIRSLEIL